MQGKNLILVSLLVILCGCSSTPTRLDEKFFDIQTNAVPRIITITNIVPAAPSPQPAGDPPLSTLPSPLPQWQTNIITITNFLESYTYTPNTNAAQLASTVTRTADLFGPWGQLAGVVIGGIIGGYGLLRSSRSAKTAGVLAQVIETGRQVLQSTPEGQAMDQQWKLWMMQHQAEQGVVLDVLKLLDNVVDEPSAKTTAQELIALIKKPTP